MAHEYLVQKWLDGKAGTWQRISANSGLDAAERVTGIQLKTVGRFGELRARVRSRRSKQRDGLLRIAAIRAEAKDSLIGKMVKI